MKPAVKLAAKATSAKVPDAALLYRPSSSALLRAPLLPVERYLDLADPERLFGLIEDLRVRRALSIGSASLAGAIDRFKAATLTKRDADRMRAKLLRYLIRMSTRPTPYGLFAGVAVARFGERTDITVRSTSARTRTRPDMAWLMKLVLPLEADATVRKRLRLTANPLVTFEAGRAHLDSAGTGVPVSLRATPVVIRALSLARTPMAYRELVERIGEASASATPEKVEKLLDQLSEQTFLLSDLRPPLTSENPARYVAERLAAIPEAAPALAKLNSLLAAATRWDDVADGREASFTAVLAAAELPLDGSQPAPVQQDMAMSVEGVIADRVAQEAARAAELLLRLSPAPRGLSSLAPYRQQFLNKYGQEREVPLTELLHPHRGLGPPSTYNYALVAPDPAKAALRSQTLLQLACGALRDRQRIVELDDKRLAQLETWKPNAETAPLSLDLNILIAASSVEAIDRGDFSIVIGPNLGAQAAGRNLARFADLIGPDGREALEQTARAEQAHASGEIGAELVYLPVNSRLANVVIRPAIRAYEVAVGVTPGVPAAQVIPLDELLVGVDRGRFYVRWPAAGKRVRFSSGHMLSYHNAPPVVRFLTELAGDAKASFTSFDWGPAESFEYLPRVQSGAVILRPAQWRIGKDKFQADSLQKWQTEWDVPRYISLSAGDNRLILDLSQDSQAAELKAELQKLNEGQSLVVEEVLPALNETWLQGAEGHYYSELVVSLVLQPPAEATPPPTIPRNGFHPPVQRAYPPGSEWLFAKVYCPTNLQDDVIPSMLTLADNILAAGWADTWFFIRYADPEPHIRLRFHGSPAQLTGQVFSQVCNWAGELLSDGFSFKFLFDTYEQELERFGGPQGTSAAEALFFADSRCAAKLLGIIKGKLWPHDITTLLVLSIDDLLRSLGLNEAERLRWYRGQTNARAVEIGADYRQRKNLLRSVVGQPGHFLAGLSSREEIATILAERSAALAGVVERLRELTREQSLTQPIETLCGSFVHLHLNRMSVPESPSEQRLLSLLLRTRESLEKAPVPLTSSSSV